MNDSKSLEFPMWHAMRAYKSELLAEKALQGIDGLECFVARRYEMRVYHGKRYRKLVPLIPSLIFVRGLRRDIYRFKSAHTFLQYISARTGGVQTGPLVVPDKQMEDFIQVASNYESEVRFVSPAEVALSRGCRVRISGGLFHGVEGTLMRDKARGTARVLVALPGNLGGITTAEIEPEWIEVLDDTPPARF